MADAMIAVIRAAAAQARHDRARSREALNEIFRAGKAPEVPLAGRYTGQLILLDIAPGLSELAAAVTSAWMPWKGKTFDPAHSSGDNIFGRDSLLLARLSWPFYRGIVPDRPGTYRAFAFRTYVAPGLFDPDREVLKIDYDLDSNPRMSIRRVLDELVEIAGGLYLGKAHLKWWWGRWQTVAYFMLEGKS